VVEAAVDPAVVVSAAVVVGAAVVVTSPIHIHCNIYCYANIFFVLSLVDDNQCLCPRFKKKIKESIT
jgi:hypothetical protein